MAELLGRLEPSELATESRIEAGEPVDVIVQLAEQTPYDLVVMGTHGRTGLSRVIIGSTAERVVRRAPCPVVTVRAPR